MNSTTVLTRRLHLIRLLQPPYTYPSKELLQKRLLEQGFEAVSERTFERDQADLRQEYGLSIRYDSRRRGYYLYLPPDEDPADFRQFVQLLERKERLDFLSESIGGRHSASRYLELENNPHFTGLDLLADLWQALLGRRVVQFTYRPYSQAEPKVRTAEPGLLFEYRNRFYLAAWDRQVSGLRTFGLDRITDLTLTDQTFVQDRTAECKTYRNHVIGVTAPANQTPERVVLRFTAAEGNYVRSLPMHPSQRILRDDAHGLEIELHVIPNHELEREILGYGQEVEVLAPASLRTALAARLRQTLARYQT